MRGWTHHLVSIFFRPVLEVLRHSDETGVKVSLPQSSYWWFEDKIGFSPQQPSDRGMQKTLGHSHLQCCLESMKTQFFLSVLQQQFYWALKAEFISVFHSSLTKGQKTFVFILLECSDGGVEDFFSEPAAAQQERNQDTLVSQPLAVL